MFQELTLLCQKKNYVCILYTIGRDIELNIDMDVSMLYEDFYKKYKTRDDVLQKRHLVVNKESGLEYFKES